MEDRVEMAEEEIYIKPDVQAIIFYLSNRVASRWKRTPTADDNAVMETLDRVLKSIGEQAAKGTDGNA